MEIATQRGFSVEGLAEANNAQQLLRSHTVDLLLMLKYSREQLPPPRTDADADAPVPAVLY